MATVAESRHVPNTDGLRALNFRDNRLIGGGFGLASTLDDYMRLARMLLTREE